MCCPAKETQRQAATLLGDRACRVLRHAPNLHYEPTRALAAPLRCYRCRLLQVEHDLEAHTDQMMALHAMGHEMREWKEQLHMASGQVRRPPLPVWALYSCSLVTSP